MPQRCTECEEEDAVVRISVTDADGVLLDASAWCRECAVHTFGFAIPHSVTQPVEPAS